MGSCLLPAGSKEARSACSGETLRMETKGNKANKIEMPVPKIMPSKTAAHEMLVVNGYRQKIFKNERQKLLDGLLPERRLQRNQ